MFKNISKKVHGKMQVNFQWKYLLNFQNNVYFSNSSDLAVQ